MPMVLRGLPVGIQDQRNRIAIINMGNRVIQIQTKSEMSNRLNHIVF